MSKVRQPYKNVTLKHPTIAGDATAYADGGKKSFEEDYTTYMQQIETIDLAIRTIANIFSLCKMSIYTKDTDGTLKPAEVKNIDLDFMNETDSRVDFMRKLAVNIYSQGAGLIVTEDAKRGKLGKMINFYNMNMSKIEAVSNGAKLISEFQYTAEDSSVIPYPAEKCIYINDSIDPSNLLYSLSRLKSLNDVILMQAGIVGQSKQMLAGGAKKASIISAETPISKRNMDKIKGEFDTFMANSSSSSFFMNTKLNVQSIGNAMTGSEMLAIFTELNEMMLKHYAIPQFLLGVSSKGANKTEEVTMLLRTFFSGQLKPVLTNIELHFTRFFREQLGLTNYVMEFDYSELDILKMPEEIQVELTTKKHKAGLITLNEARKMIELPPLEVDSANYVYMPAYLLGNAPVSYDNYDADLERSLNLAASGAPSEEALPAGNAGDDDNENVQTGSTGGEQDD